MTVASKGEHKPAFGSRHRRVHHRPFLWAALAFIVSGSTLGALMLASLSGRIATHAWTAHLQVHGQMQIYGFLVLFTMGVVHQMMHQVLGLSKSAWLIPASFWATLSGTALSVLSALWPIPRSCWASLQLLGGALFLISFVANRRAAIKSPPNSASSWFLSTGLLCLVGAQTMAVLGKPILEVYDLILWGFAANFVLGVGLGMHAPVLGQIGPSQARQFRVWGLWNAGVTAWLWPPLRPVSATCLGMAAILVVFWLHIYRVPRRPQPMPWLSRYLRLAYSWLWIAALLRVSLAWPGSWGGFGLEGATRHALASGFLLTMMIGMGFRLIPAFEGKELSWPWARTLCWVLLAGGTPARVLCQALLGRVDGAARLAPWAGLAQACAVVLFVLSLAVTMRTRSSPFRIHGGQCCP